uniref:Uncharacterized protein n=1 Tax=Anguilla anguilla TaxID=7936 RepID=A0A0E9UHN7_ANGAN
MDSLLLADAQGTTHITAILPTLMLMVTMVSPRY